MPKVLTLAMISEPTGGFKNSFMKPTKPCVPASSDGIFAKPSIVRAMEAMTMYAARMA